MTGERNKALVERYLELYRTGSLAIADQIVAAEFVDHAHPEMPPGAEGVKRMVQATRDAFADSAVAVHQLIAEGDFVAFHFTIMGTHFGPLGNLPASGKRITLRGIDLFRVADGKLAELWSYQTTLEMLQQMGFTLTRAEQS